MFRNSRNAPFHIKCCYTELGLSRNETPLRRGIPPPDASMELRRSKALLGGSPIPIIVTAALSQSSLARRTIGLALGTCRSFLLSLSPSGANLCGYINKTAGKRIKKKKRKKKELRSSLRGQKQQRRGPRIGVPPPAGVLIDFLTLASSQ